MEWGSYLKGKGNATGHRAEGSITAARERTRGGKPSPGRRTELCAEPTARARGAAENREGHWAETQDTLCTQDQALIRTEIRLHHHHHQTKKFGMTRNRRTLLERGRRATAACQDTLSGVEQMGELELRVIQTLLW